MNLDNEENLGSWNFYRNLIDYDLFYPSEEIIEYSTNHIVIIEMIIKTFLIREKTLIFIPI